MKEIKLTQGQFALVDDEDYDRLVAMGKWVLNNGYAAIIKSFKNEHGKRTSKAIYMHRVVAKDINAPMIDHIDQCRVNNQKHNLRGCDFHKNGANSKKQSNNTSGYKGVHWDKRKNKWRAMIGFEMKLKHIGHYEDIKEAASAYNQAALNLFGEFAKLNQL